MMPKYTVGARKEEIIQLEYGSETKSEVGSRS